MDDTQGSRMSDAVATRKRRSSILKNQRPPRTPLSDVEFNVATPTDTAKSRRVSFSRRTDVAEFATNEGTTTWKTMYVEQNRSLESSGNESVMYPSRQTVCSLGKRAIFEQVFQGEAEVDLGTTSPNINVQEMNMSLMGIKFSQQIADLEREDMKFSAPQKLELSSFTEDRSKLFGELTAPMTGVSNKIDVDFSAIQPVGDKCYDLDEIQRDLLGKNSNTAQRMPFGSQDASEYIEIDTTQIGKKCDFSDMSITDSIRSPVKGIQQVEAKKDWTNDKENIAMNPYIAPKESLNFATNEIPDQVLVFDGKKLSVQTERQVFESENVEYHQQMSSDSPAQKKTIVLNVNDDLPNFNDTPLFQVHGISTNKIDDKSDFFQPNPVSIPTGLVPNSLKTVIYDNLAEDSVTQAIPTNILEKEKRRTIVFENDGGELSMTQALPTNIPLRSDVTQNRTVVYGSEDISFTQALPAKVLPRDVAMQNKTVVYGSEDISITQAVPVNVLSNEIDKTKSNFEISFTQALPSNVLLSNKSIEPNRRNTIVYGNDGGDISVTRVLPSNIIMSDNLKTGESIISSNPKSLHHKSIVYEKGCDISITQAVPKNIILPSELKPYDEILYDGDENEISETKMLPSNIVEPDRILESDKSEFHKHSDTLKPSDEFTINMSITQAIPENMLLSNLIGKRKTIDGGNMSVTRVLPTNIIMTEKSAIDDNLNDFPITQSVPNNIVILNDDQETNTIEKIDSKRKTLDLSAKEIAATDIAANVTSNDQMEMTELIERDNLTKSFAKTDLSKSNMNMTIIQTVDIDEYENVHEKSQWHEDKYPSQSSEIRNNLSVETLKPADILLNDLKNDKIEETGSNDLISDDKNAKSIYCKEKTNKKLSLVKEEDHASILETSKQDRHTKLDISETENMEFLEKSCKQSEEILHISQNIPNKRGLIQNFETNTQKPVSENSLRDVFVYQAVAEHNVSKQMKNIDILQSNTSQPDLCGLDIIPQSITLTNAMESNDMKVANNDKNISINKTLRTDMDKILEMSVTEEQKNDALTDEVIIESDLIFNKRYTQNKIEFEDEPKGIVMESPQKNDITLVKDYKEPCSRMSTIQSVSYTPQPLRNSIIIEGSSKNMDIPHLIGRKTLDQTDVKDDHAEIVMESPHGNDITLDKEQKEQYSRLSTIRNASTVLEKSRKSILIEGITLDKTNFEDHHADIVMKSPHGNDITLDKEQKEQYSRLSTIRNASTVLEKSRKSILIEGITVDKPDFEDDHADIVMESPHRNDITMDNEQKEQYSRLSTIRNASTVLEKSRKSILIEGITVDQTDIEDDHADIVMKSPHGNDITLDKEQKEQYSRLSTIRNASTVLEKSRKSILIEGITVDKPDCEDDHTDIVMESPHRNDITMDKEQKEQYSRLSTIRNASTVLEKSRKSILIEGITVDLTDIEDDNKDIVMDSSKQNDKLATENNQQCFRVSAINASAMQNKPRKSILSELLNMSDDSMDVSADNQSAITEKELQDELEHMECNKTRVKEEELKESNKSYEVTEISQPNINILEHENADKLQSSKTDTHYSNVIRVNHESTHLNDSKQPEGNPKSDFQKEEIAKEEMAIEEAKEVSENYCKQADNTNELLEMLSDLSDKTMIKQSKELPERVGDQIKSNENSYSNEPSRLSLAKSRKSIVMSREDLRMNISMAFAALQQARAEEDSDNEDILDDSAEDKVEPAETEEIDAVDEIDEAIKELDNRRRSIRASTEVVKTLQFDESMTEGIPKSEENLSPLRKSVFGDISQIVDSRARVIPSYEVSEEVKSLMQDLVKPMADDTVFGKTSPEKSTKPTNSTRSINLQANIITSSQIDIDTDSESGIASINVQTAPEEIANNIIKSPKYIKEPILRKSDQIRLTPPVLVFDPANPLNNVILPKGNTDIHKYSPNKSQVSIAQGKYDSPIKTVLEKNNEEYEIQRVSTHYKINTSAVAMNYSKEKDFRNLDASNRIDDSFDAHIKDSEVNTLIAMKCNKELLEETSCLTLVDDDDQEPIVIEDTHLDSEHQQTETTSPVQVIFKTDACDDNYTSSVDLDSDDGKAKKRIYSPAKPDPTKKVATSNPEVTPKPLSKIQKITNTPNNGSKRSSITHNETESLNKSNLKEKMCNSKAVGCKGNFGGTLIVQQMAECKIDNSMDAVSSPRSEHSSCTLKAEVSSTDFKPANAASKDVSFSHSDPTPLSYSIIKEKETKVLSERESSANILEKIDSLSFMGDQDCQWDWSDATTWRFRLLRGRLRLIINLGQVTGNKSVVQVNGIRCGGHVRADTPFVSATVELVQENPDPLFHTCLRLASEAMRYECVRPSIKTARSIPTLLRRCVALAKIARSWVRVMKEARMLLAYTMSADGMLKLNIANISLKTVYELTFHIQLSVEDAREGAWARADGIRVRDVTSRQERHGDDVTPSDVVDLDKLLAKIPHDWGHVPRTLWKVFRHLKNKTKDEEWLGI